MLRPEPVEACGCFNPPVPPPGVTAADYAVAQQSEQIIFEVEEGYVTAHVLIQYQGKPESFAWIVPVPSEPELGLSENLAFGILDNNTRPQVFVNQEPICPAAAWSCRRHPNPGCGSPDPSPGPPRGGADAGSFGGDTAAGGPGGMAPPVDVISRQVIGSYDTVVFAATDAMLAVGWLVDEGFIVNDTMTPYLQGYIEMGMLFVASRLVPGAGVEEIRPLKMRYAAETPMIPLQLTAVAAEPHLTVTAYIYGERSFQPTTLPMTEIDPSRISVDAAGRTNYPMVLSATVDEAGGNAFVVEYDGSPYIPLGDDSGCCSAGFDQCGVGFDGLCQCPGSEIDMEDCSAIDGLLEGVELVNDLAMRHTHLTRLSTRVSPEEMTFDPCFEPGRDHALNGRLFLTGSRPTLAGCVGDIIDRPLYLSIESLQDCASVYCGETAECGITPGGPGCACGPDSVARTFLDLDGEFSVTCVPDTPPVDLGAGGLLLPDACDGVSCGAGYCVDVGGFASCRCNPGAAAVVEPDSNIPSCRPLLDSTRTPGAANFTEPLRDVRVCAPAPPTSCGDYGWLEASTPRIAGEICATSMPDPRLLAIPDAPTCEDLGLPDRVGGGGCSAATPVPASAPIGAGLLALALGLVFVRRRR